MNFAGAMKRPGLRQPASLADNKYSPSGDGFRFFLAWFAASFGSRGWSLFGVIVTFCVKVLSAKFLAVQQHNQFVSPRSRQEYRFNRDNHVNFSQTLRKVQAWKGRFCHAGVAVEGVGFHAHIVLTNAIIELHEHPERLGGRWECGYSETVNQFVQADLARRWIFPHIVAQQNRPAVRQRFIRVSIHKSLCVRFAV